MTDPKVLRWKAFAAASGPGGQHVNKVSTAVELRCRVHGLGLGEVALSRLVELAGRKVSAEGELVIVAKEHRSLERNREAALAKLEEMVAEARRIPRKRRATRPTRGSQVRRIEGKKKRGETKRLRRGGDE